MLDTSTIYIIVFFILSSVLGHFLLHRICSTQAQYTRPSQRDAWSGAAGGLDRET
ncbi:hypothetical protein EJ07DRAFT_121512 [Lizonia empirigonia]|nr:hypothetical protein EJ07DRAFT_121512 [Lizonia empirigonia]